MKTTLRQFRQFGILLAALLGAASTSTRADEVTDWNQHMLSAAKVANSSPLVASRVGAIVQASVFDAVNGIERRHTAVHVPPAAPAGASVRAAAVQAAYVSLVKLYPAQKSTFDAALATSLAGISSGAAAESSQSIASGVQWGQAVADAIWTWKSADGFDATPPPFLGGSAVGQWRPTPPGNLPGAGVQFATMTPWALTSPSQFRPPGPPALDSAKNAADYNEVKDKGSLTSLTRTPDETVACNFWASATVTYLWNRVAVSVSAERHLTLAENARLLAVLNIALADAVIACWEAKYHYVFWRPVTAIPLGETDGNAATTGDPAWTPLFAGPPFATPNHPEYPSGHSMVSGAGVEVLAAYFGDETSFTVDTDYAPLAGVTRSFSSFSKALEEVKNARIFAGIHFRAACDDGRDSGRAVANHVMAKVALNHADVVLDWNTTAEVALFAPGVRPGPVPFLDIGIVHAAVHDAVQAIDKRFESYHVIIPGASGSPAAAAAKAAHDVLVNILPAQAATFDTAYTASLAKYALAENDPGVAVGAQAAAGIIALRANDGRVPSPLPPPFVGGTKPGEWRPSLPANAPMAAPWLGAVPTFTINGGDQFRPQPQPSLDSQRYAQDYNEVKAVGGLPGTGTRTPEQTELAYFYGGTSWQKILRDISGVYVDDIGDRARLFALAELAIADSFITAWDSKVHFNFWRPITAIQEGEKDGNPETVGDPNWLPLFPTPPYPDYTSGFNNATAALTRTFAHFFGTDYMTFTVTSTHALAVQKSRTFYRFSDLSDDAVDVRIFQGIHFRFADEEAQKQGRSVADWTFGHYLRPLGNNFAEPGLVLQQLNGSLAFWRMNGTTIMDSIDAGTIPAGWQVVGSADFNHDDQKDLVLQHTDGSIAFWMLDGTTITERITLFAVPAGWHVVATGDFDGDSQADLVLQNVDGTTAFWFMEGTSVTGTELSHQVAGWRVAGTGRFDHNATTDIVLQHTDGSVAFWLMDGTTIEKGVVPYKLTGSWQIVATGSYNPDNDTDIVLQDTNFAVAFWLMNGTTITQGIEPYTAPPGWRIVSPR